MPRPVPHATGWTKAFIHTSVKKPRHTATDRTMLEPHTHRQLFLNAQAVERMDGIERILHQPRKQGPVLRAAVESR